MRAIVFLCLALVGCTAAAPLARDPDRAKAQIAALIPDGTPVEVAQQRLEQKGLRCNLRQVEGPERKTYLYGSADRSAGPMVNRGWLVHFEVKNDQVYAPCVGVKLTGP